ncbi:MAG: ATP-binding protein [Pseudomonadota bacterium]
MNTLLAALACAVVAILLLAAALLRQRKEFEQALEELPTGLCVLSGDERVLRWNSQMSDFSGLSGRQIIGQRLDSLPSEWAEALGVALREKRGTVIKRALSDRAGETRWVLLHSGKSLRDGSLCQIVVEDISDFERLQDELQHQERLASIGRLAAGVAHEIGNPVTGIACVAQNLADHADAAELEQGTAEILKQTERITRTVGTLMQLSHPGSSPTDANYTACNLADCIDEAIHLLKLDVENQGGEFENSCDRELLVLADSQWLLQVFLNLIDNAQTASNHVETVCIAAEVSDERVRVSIDNTCEPLTDEIMDQAFEPFFTTKDVGQGTGLGLPLVRRMIEDMGGSIRLISPIPESGQGVRVELVLRAAYYDDAFEEKIGEDVEEEVDAQEVGIEVTSELKT